MGERYDGRMGNTDDRRGWYRGGREGDDWSNRMGRDDDRGRWDADERGYDTRSYDDRGRIGDRWRGTNEERRTMFDDRRSTFDDRRGYEPSSGRGYEGSYNRGYDDSYDLGYGGGSMGSAWGRDWEGRRDWEGNRREFGPGGEMGFEDRWRSGMGRGFARGGSGASMSSRFQGRGYGWQGQNENLANQGPYYGKGPKGYTRNYDRVREDVNEALARHPQIDASEIEVAMDKGEVTLTGSVQDRNQKRLAEMVVEQVDGVNDVHNQLRVMTMMSQGGNQPGMRNAPASATTRKRTDQD